MARAITLALTLAAGGMIGTAQAAGPRPFSGDWFAAKGATRASVTAASNAGTLAGMPPPLAQQQQANQQLARSIANLGKTAAAIAAQQAMQDAARQAALNAPGGVPDGLVTGGLKVDANPATQGWLNADAPTQSTAGGHTQVSINQTKDKAILNWETFNVGKNTEVDFHQQSSWAVLNRVNDPNAHPSQIEGQIKGDGTVLLINRNGVIFSGSSQVNVRNLVAAAADISDSRFTANGIYSTQENGSYIPLFTDAAGKVLVSAGAQIATTAPGSATQGGGYVLLMGSEVDNAGAISTPQGQTTLAAGDNFAIRKGVGTNDNTASTTRGNEVAPLLNIGSMAGRVNNTGIIVAREGDVTLAGHAVAQDGVTVATTTVNTRGTIHLLNSAGDAAGQVQLGDGAITAVLIDDDGKTVALDSQRDALAVLSGNGLATGQFDNLSILADRRDQSRVEIVSGGDITFADNSMTLATGGQIEVSAGRRTFVADGADLDVAGAVGVQVAMSSNNILVNVQGNELRDAPVNRDSGKLANNDLWVDDRSLRYVPAGTGGDGGERWYTSGGLLEVSGYLSNQDHSIGEWAAIGGTLVLGGNEVVTQAGSRINISGGSIDVQTGYLKQSWLKGANGLLYNVNTAPADLLYTGVYKGYEADHARWGDNTTEYFLNPLIAVQQVLQNGYTVGRDAGQLIVSAPTGVLEGDVAAAVYNGPRQVDSRPTGVTDGYKLAHDTAALAGRLVVGHYTGLGLNGAFDSDIQVGDIASITSGMGESNALPDERANTVWLDANHLNAQELGGLTLISTDGIAIDAPLTLTAGGELILTGPQIDINADTTARGGDVQLSNIMHGVLVGGTDEQWWALNPDSGPARITIADGVTIDLRGLWSNLAQDPDGNTGSAYLNGGSLRISTTGGITLGAGSLVDASSGAAILSDGSTKGGKGGDVYLVTNDFSLPNVVSRIDQEDAPLIINGDIRSYGFTGGGTLTLGAGQTVVIGKDSNLSSDTLPAGTAAGTSVRLAEDVTLAAGDKIPFAWDVTITRLPLDTPIAVPYSIDFSKTLTTTAEWTLPSGLYAIAQNGAQYFGGMQIPTGTTLTRLSSTSGIALPIGAVLPSAVFGSGVPIAPARVKSYAAGDTLTDPVFLPKGYIVAQGVVFDRAVQIAPVLTIDPVLFQSGFSNYNISSTVGMEIGAGAAIAPVVPVYRFAGGGLLASNGAELAASTQLWTPPTYIENPVKDQLDQRAGADLTLTSAFDFNMARGASIEVDPGHSAALYVGRQTTISGDITAPGGAITITSPRLTATILNNYGLGLFTPTRSVWIDDGATLDVAGRAVVAMDSDGRRYGIAPDGGTIALGTATGADNYGFAAASNAFIVIRPDAVLDASGAGATIDLPIGSDSQTGPVEIEGSGGTINLASSSGIYLDGTLRAAAGGANAAGGTLGMTMASRLYTPTLPSFQGDSAIGVVPDGMETSRIITLVQDYAPSNLSADARPGDTLAFGQGTLGVDQLHAGGFDAVSLYSNNAFVLSGDVNLSLGRSIAFAGAPIGTAANTPDAHVTIAAPYVSIEGTNLQPGGAQYPVPYFIPGLQSIGGGLASISKDSSFTVDADLIDLKQGVGFGAYGALGAGYLDGTLPGGVIVPVDRFIDIPGFGNVVLNSRGDIRLGNGSLNAANLTLQASQIYPMSGASMIIAVGSQNDNTYDPDAVLTIRRNGDATPSLPGSVYGRISLIAPTIDQGGVLLAPLGAIEFGSVKGNANFPIPNAIVTFRAGSVTSTSADGLIVPFGGTSDGITYNGATVPLDPSTNQPINVASTVINDTGNYKIVGGIAVNATQVIGESGSLIDVSGGGTLAGEGFLSGRGGSVDVLKTALVNANPVNPGGAGDKIYAIVPGYASDYAPVIASNGAGNPIVGQQITIPAGVPGLASGTYTLLPSSYALLPGGYRVELTGNKVIGNASQALIDGSVITSGTLGIANTNVHDNQATGIILSPGETVRRYAQYNEQSYSDFARAQAAQFGALRQRLPEDGGVLELNVGIPQDGSAALQFAGSTNFDAGKGGYDGTLIIASNSFHDEIDITAPGATAITGHTSISSESINAFQASTLLLGGVSTYAAADGADAGGRIALQGNNNIHLLDGTDLRAGAVFLIGPNIDISAGATVDTRGISGTRVDSTIGYLYGNTTSEVQSPGGPAVIAIGNGYYDFLPPSGVGTIGIASGATLLTEGTINLAAGGSLTMGDVNFGAKNLIVTQNQINAGSDAALAAADADGVLAPGWTLTQAALDRLLKPSAISGVPALEQLILTAGDAISLFGDVALDATGQDVTLVLNTPALYGLGGSGDVASIKADTLYWNGIRTGNGSNSLDPVPYGSKAPAPVMPGGAGTGQGTLLLDAQTIIFGYDPSRQPTDGTTLDRVALGFSTVELSASERISGNDDGTLSVGRTRDDSGKLQGGDLVMTTPLITASKGATMAFTAGGMVSVAAPAGVAPADTAAVSDLGGTLSFTGSSVNFDTAAALPSGKLTLSAANDVTLGDNARVDLGGRAVSFFDVTQYGWGGDLVLQSEQGGIRQAAGAVIDVSAGHNDAGTISATAINGTVAFDGTLKGQSSDGYASGGIALTEQTQSDFDTFNAKLDDAGFYTSRGFDIRQGSLVVDNILKARNIAISVDGGSLTINGTLDASGAAPGTIRLAARDDLSIGGGALLDTHGTTLQTDSYGQAVEAGNTGHIELASTSGTVSLASGATIDMRTPDGAARGKVEIDARRLGLGDVAVRADSGLVIKGAGSVAVNAFRTYILANGTVIDQAMLDGFDADSRTFINASYGSDGHLTDSLLTKLAGLLATGNAFHYRPGVELVSPGDLSTSNDLDLSGYRYGPGVDSARPGSGEAGTLVVRAAGNVNINGSVTDGFAPPPDSPDSNQWLIPVAGYVPDDYVYLSANVTLAEDWTIPNDPAYSYIYDTAFNYYSPGQVIPSGTTIDVVDFGFAWAPGYQIPTTLGPGVPRPVYAIAAPLAAGSQSWSMSIVAGADTAAADIRTLRTRPSLNGSGNLVLNDPHLAEGGASFGYSVIRTGTGDLTLLAGGDFDQRSAYGIYTAGTPIAATGTDANAPYNVGRGVFADGTLLGAANADYEASLGAERMYYVEHGGDVIVSAQGDIKGTEIAQRSANVGDWLLRQGGSAGQATAWGISFGSYVGDYLNGLQIPRLDGFSGIGTLGGGNVLLAAGGNIGDAGRGIVAAVGATGRVMADGSLAQTGGGSLTVKAGGNIGTGDNQFVDLRGDTVISAGDFGQSYGSDYGFPAETDPRASDPLRPFSALRMPGGSVAIGDGTVDVRARGDLVMGSTINPGLAASVAYTDAGGLDQGATWFNLWSDHTAVDLFAAGGDLSPFVTGNTTLYLPPVVKAVAPGGNIYLSVDGQRPSTQLPSPYGALDLLAGGSVIETFRIGNGAIGALSSPLSAIATPFHPGWLTQRDGFGYWTTTDTDYYGDPANAGDGQNIRAIDTPFVFGPNSASDDSTAAVDGISSHIYAVDGDIISLIYGQIYIGLSFANNQSIYTTNYQAAKPVSILAGQDIINLRSVILQQDPNDISTIAAGRDILYAGVNHTFYNANTKMVSEVSGLQIAGPGTLELTAGRNIYQGSLANVESIGPILTGDTRPGASIVLQAGVGAGMPGVGAVDWEGFAALYLDPANLIGTEQGRPLPIEGSGKVAKTYNDELYAWLKDRYGYTGTQTDALAVFLALPGAQQRVFLRQVYYAELTAAGREFNDPDSSRFNSYLRGREAIATLFPVAKGATGDITMFTTANPDTFDQGAEPLSGSVRTDFGGDIQLLAPEGGVTVGTEGLVPGSSAGLITQGAGNIQIYSKDSLLLGLSRIMTTFGGDILAWSAEGDINAGRGSKTTIVYTPPKRVYDNVGDVTISPNVPSTGAGIATLAPIPEVPPGDIDLIAPLGTVDAGEAGIRFSGNLNVAALHVVNAANIQGQGKATGLPTVAAVNVGALTAASQAAGSAVQAAEQISRQAQRNQPSIISVQILGYGSDRLESGGGGINTTMSAANSLPVADIRYDQTSPVQVLGHGDAFDSTVMSLLTEAEQRKLRNN